MAFENIPNRLFWHAQTRPEAPAYYTKVNGIFQPTNWRGYADEVKRAAKSLIAHGLLPGQTVALLGVNRPEWVIFDVAAMAVGGAPAGIYTTSSAKEVHYILHHAESSIVLAENMDQWAKIQKELDHLPHLRRVVMMKGAPTPEHPIAMSWDAFMQAGIDVSDKDFAERLAALKPAGLAMLIYTSGTTGPPKAVMLSHENLAWTASGSRDVNKVRASDTNLSYLPLSHIAEQMFTIHTPITAGSAVYFAESLEKVPQNLREVQPTMFFGVPRIWEKFYFRIREKLAEAKGMKKAIAEHSMQVAAAYHNARLEGRPASIRLDLEYRIANKIFLSKLKGALGLGRARVLASGGAPIAADILRFFLSLDMVVQELYGQSEGSGPTSYNLADRTRIGSVGPAFPGVEVKIAEDDEILLKGPNVFLGYFKDPAATAETLRDGWLHSGDLGKIDADGFLHITGRKKDLIITAGGKNIAPMNIETALKEYPLIGEAVVVGDRRKYLTALISLDAEIAARFAAERGIAGPPGESAEVRAAVQQAIDEVNKDLAQVEQVKNFCILPRPLTVEAGELTATLKVKRNVVSERYIREIEAMYTA